MFLYKYLHARENWYKNFGMQNFIITDNASTWLNCSVVNIHIITASMPVRGRYK